MCVLPDSTEVRCTHLFLCFSFHISPLPKPLLLSSCACFPELSQPHSNNVFCRHLYISHLLLLPSSSSSSLNHFLLFLSLNLFISFPPLVMSHQDVVVLFSQMLPISFFLLIAPRCLSQSSSRFLEVSTHLYKRVCPSVGPFVVLTVGPSVGPSVSNPFFFIGKFY